LGCWRRIAKKELDKKKTKTKALNAEALRARRKSEETPEAEARKPRRDPEVSG
jgi:hypothetical protein